MNRGHAKCVAALVIAGVIACIVPATALADAAGEAPRWYVRLGAIHIASEVDSSSFELSLRAIPGVTFGSGPLPRDTVGVEPLTLIGGNVGFVLPVLDHRLALETLVAIPPKNVKLVAKGALANESLLPTVFGIPTGIPPLGRELAELTALPPSFTAVYHAPALGPVTPILGVGAIALIAVDVKVTNPLLNRISKVEFDVPPAVGFIAQGGLDVHLWGPVQARLDVKYISLSTRLTIKNIEVKTGLPLIGDLPLGDADVRASVHTWIAQLGVGADF